MTGLSFKQAMGQGWRAAIHPEDAPRLFREWDRAVEKKQVFQSRYRYRQPSGKVLEVIGSAVFEKGPRGTVKGYIGIVMEVTVGPAGGEEDEPVLTAREVEVVRKLAAGLSNKEVAAEMNLSTRTVETHRMRIRKKLRIRSTAELVAYVLQRGLL